MKKGTLYTAHSLSPLPPIGKQLEAVVHQTASQFGLGTFADSLATSATPSILLAPVDHPSPHTRHQAGGLPLVTEHFQWPEPMSFLAQIDLGQLPIPLHPALPDEGLLQFFYDAEKQEDGPCGGRERQGSILWTHGATVHPAPAPQTLTERNQDGVFHPLAYEAFPGISISPMDGYPMESSAHTPTSDDWKNHDQLVRDLRAMAAPTRAKARGRHGIVRDEDWLQMGGHVRYFRDAGGYNYLLGAILEKHGLVREFAWGAAKVRKQIEQYGDTIPDWCAMLKIQVGIFERHQQAFRQEADELVLLLQVPTLNRLGAVFGDDHFVSYVIPRDDLAHQRFDQAWVMTHP